MAHAGKSDRASFRTICVREKVRPGTGREAGLGHDAYEPTGMYLKRRQWRESDFAEGKKVLPECRCASANRKAP